MTINNGFFRTRGTSSRILAGFGVGILIFVMSMVVGVAQTFAAAGDFDLTVNQELGSGLTGATVTAYCAGASGSITLSDAGSGHYTASAAAMASAPADCNNGESISFNVAKDGYVSVADGSHVYVSGSDPDTYTISNVRFAVKITATNELGNPATGASVGAGTNQLTVCTEDGSTGVYYCPVPLADLGTGISIQKAGFVQQTTISGVYSDRTSASQSQVTGTITDFQYGHKVLTNVSGATVTAGSGSTSCVASGSTYYCPVPASQDNGSTVTVAKSGYISVTRSIGNRADDTSAQIEDDIYSYTDFSSDNPSSFGLHVTITDELDNSLDNASPTFNGSAPTYSNGNDYYWADTSGEHILAAIADGYVTATSTVTTNTSSQTSVSISNLRYAYKITGVTTEALNTDLTGSLSTLSVGDSSGTDECTLSGGSWYCPVVLANSNGTLVGNVELDGYVRQDYNLNTGTTRTVGTDPQRVDTVPNVKYAYKLTNFYAEATESSLTPTAVVLGDRTGSTTCAYAGGSWYCAAVVANTDEYPTTVKPTVDGFVKKQYYGMSSRSSQDSAQVTDTVGGILYGYKINNVYSELGDYLTPNSVTAGDSYGTTCVNNDNSWYCAIPLASSSTAFKLAKPGYVTYTGNFSSDRTSDTDNQVSVSSASIQYAYKVTGEVEPYNSTRLAEGYVYSGEVDCDEDGTTGVYYCAIPTTEDGGSIYLTKSGFETSSVTATERANDDAAQVALVVSDIRYQLKVHVGDELGNDLIVADLDTITFNGESPDETTAQDAYWAIDTGEGSGTLIIHENGYVAAEVTNPALNGEGAGVATGPSTGQTYIVLGNAASSSSTIADGAGATIKGLQHGIKVVTKQSWLTDDVHESVNSASVSGGSSYGISCFNDDDSDSNYCPFLTGEGGTESAKIIKSGYLTKYALYPVRSSVYDTQRTITAFLDVPGDTSAPQVSFVRPDGEGPAAITAHPYVVFTKDIDPTTASSSTIYLCTGGECGDRISATVQMSEGNTRATIVPDANLNYDTTYYIYVTDGVKDIANNPLSVEGYYASSFHTETQANGSLTISSITPINTYASSTNDYDDGFSWKLNVTVPTDEQHVQLKFSDFVSGSNSIPAAGNMIFYSSQSENATSDEEPIYISAAGTYPIPGLIIDGDLDESTPGRQIEIYVKMKVPEGTAGGSYGGSYGIHSEEAVF